MNLRDYQQRDYDRIRSAFRKHSRVCYQAPTGSGKTVLFCHLARNAADRGTRVCILVHRRELLRQASKALTAYGVHHGIIAPGVDTEDGLVHVASKDTLVRRDREFDLYIVDEAHHTVASTYQKIIQSTPVLGVTATPCRLSGAGLGTVFDSLVIGPTVRELMDAGWLARYRYFGPPCAVSLKGVASRGGDWAREGVAALMDKPAINGDLVQHYEKFLSGQPAVVFCATVAHAKSVAETFVAAGHAAASVDGAMHQQDRDAVLGGLSDGSLRVVTSCDLIGEGLDIPAVAGALLARPTKSLSVFLQQIGRTLRPAEGKDCAVILDHVGNHLRHGLPDAPREWTLEQGAVKTKAEPVKQCPVCFGVHDPAPECPMCGHVYAEEKPKPRKGLSYKEAALEEVQMTHEEMAELTKQARTLQDWHNIGKRSGKTPGWAFVNWKRRRMSR